MTVRELIRALTDYDMDTDVVIEIANEDEGEKNEFFHIRELTEDQSVIIQMGVKSEE